MPHQVQVTTPGDREILMVRRFDAPRELVWQAYTRADLVKRWLFGPDGWSLEVLHMDVRPGGTFEWHWHNADGRQMVLNGRYNEIEAPARIVHTELFDEDWTGGETVNTVTFDEEDGQTLLSIRTVYASTEGRNKALASGMTEGMEMGYARLDGLLEEIAAAA